jgi:predicted nucleotidyltransferase
MASRLREKFENEENFISGIYNYCDRWCERCAFTARCRVYAMEQTRRPQGEDESDEDYFVSTLSETFQETLEMIQEMTEEQGIEIDTESPEAIAAWEEHERKAEEIRNSELVKQAEDYAFTSREIFSSLRDEQNSGEESDSDDVGDSNEIAMFYMFTIAVKINHALSSRESEFENPEYETEDGQKHSNGVMKVALIAMDRSITAWRGLLNEKNKEQVQPLINTLEDLRLKCEREFPEARNFIRPGFDEIEESIA